MIIDCYKDPNSYSEIIQMPLQRDWMDITFDKHAYHCFPISLANRLGWGISFKNDVSFIWDGINTSESDHIKILSGSEFTYTGRGNRTLSFDTGISISPQKNISILTVPPPNLFFDGFQCISTIISSSVLIGTFPIAIMVYKPNQIITIKAGTPVASIFPIRLSDLNDTILNIKNESYNFSPDEKSRKKLEKRASISHKLNQVGKWTDFYRNAVDADGEKYGEHEVKKISMRVNYED